MSAALSPEPDEPRGSGLPGDADGGMPQGLYITAPAEDLSLEGFAADGRADTTAPGPLLAMVLDTVAGPDGTGLAGLSDDQLIGFLSGARRMESRLAWATMAALAEFASRPRRSDFAADEIAAAFRLTWLSAAGEIAYAQTVARRLPVTFAALAAGKIDAVHVKIIEDTTSVLSGEDAALADEILAGAAPSKTYAELRRATGRLVLRLDPEAVRRRKEKTRREARVRSFREESGNAGITGREMPGAMGGDTGPGGEVDGFGILDHADTRDLMAAAARNPATRWCLTVLNPDGTAAAHACAAGPRPWRSAHGPPGHQPGTTTLPGLLDLLNITQLTPVIRGPCEHAQAEDRYRPSRNSPTWSRRETRPNGPRPAAVAAPRPATSATPRPTTTAAGHVNATSRPRDCYNHAC